MITKNTITPWYQPQLQSFRINYLDNLLELDRFDKDKEQTELSLPKKYHSLNTLEPKPKISLRNVIGFERFRTMEKIEKRDKREEFIRKERSEMVTSKRMEKEKTKNRLFFR